MLLLYVQDIKLRFETHYDNIFLGTDLVLTNVWFLPLPAASPSWPWPSLSGGRVTRCRADLELGWDREDKCLPNFKVVVIDCLNARLAQIFWTKREAVVVWLKVGEATVPGDTVPVASVTIASGHQPHICSLRTPPSWITTHYQCTSPWRMASSGKK